MRIEISRAGTTTGSTGVTVTVEGEIDSATAPPLAEAIRAELAGRPPRLTLSLREVGFCSARGVGVLVAAGDAARDQGVELRIDACSRPVRRVLEACRVVDLLPGERPVAHRPPPSAIPAQGRGAQGRG